MTLTVVEKHKCFEGECIKYSHVSKTVDCVMKFNVFLPKESQSQRVPAIYYLSGLSCNEDNFIHKSGAMCEAAKHGIALIACDTSPRGVEIEGDRDNWDLGVSAGFYVDATVSKWSRHYRMYSYVVDELRELVSQELPIDDSRISIMGHSMGGHGALMIYLRNQSVYKTASAFAPISHPIHCPWGQKAFANYLGTDQSAWESYDAVHLLKTMHVKDANVLIDVGTSDAFLQRELNIDALKQTINDRQLGNQWMVRLQDGYDHSYFFISTFISDHIRHHAKALQ